MRKCLLLTLVMLCTALVFAQNRQISGIVTDAQNTPLPVTAQEGVNVMKIIELAIKSNTKKRIIKIS